jgi:DNA-binding MarR family transcriptional regulator
MSRRSDQREIARFRSRFMDLFRRLRREAQSDDRSWARLSLLGAIARAEGQATPSMLAESESMRSSNLAALLRDLEAEGLITRVPDRKDGRMVRVRLTRAGRDLWRDNIERREHWLAEAVAQVLTERERERLFAAGALLERLAAFPGPRPRSGRRAGAASAADAYKGPN